jgi:hypothetical protein
MTRQRPLFFDQIVESTRIIFGSRLGHADEAVTAKQAGYADWGKGRPAVLIATAGTKDKYEGGFKLRLWKDVCASLRREVRLLVSKGNVLLGAQMLLFIAALEEHLLKIPAALLRNLFNQSGSLLLTPDEREIESILNWMRLEDGNGH